MEIKDLEIGKKYRRKAWDFKGFAYYDNCKNLYYWCDDVQQPIIANYELLTSNDWYEHYETVNEKLAAILAHCRKASVESLCDEELEIVEEIFRICEGHLENES